jgi:hypothetical protein
MRNENIQGLCSYWCPQNSEFYQHTCYYKLQLRKVPFLRAQIASALKHAGIDFSNLIAQQIPCHRLQFLLDYRQQFLAVSPATSYLELGIVPEEAVDKAVITDL